LNKTDPRNQTKSHEQNSYASGISWIVLPGEETFQNWGATSDIDRFGQCQPVCYILDSRAI
jgi:hypothetical protein